MYTAHSHTLTLRDQPTEEERLDRLKYHLQTGDYFPLLATIFGFAEDTVRNCSCALAEEVAKMETEVISNFRKDLMYLHKNYQIVPKDAKEQ